MDGVQLRQGYKATSYYEETVHFLPLFSQKSLVLIWLTSEKWNAEMTSEPPSGFGHGTPFESNPWPLLLPVNVKAES